jgi:hypothetical protein
MEYIRNMFYRVVFTPNIPNTPVNIVEDTQKNINLQKYNFNVEKFDKDIEAICINNMFYKYK